MKFAQLLFGMDIPFENYSERLPHATEKSFLLFAKGACAEGRPLRKIQEFIPKQMEEIAEWEQNVRGNSSRPTKSQQMLGRDKSQVYYWSVQLTRASCLCRSVFGADAHQKHVPTSAEVWGTASKFAKLWDATLARNYAHFQTPHMRPIWLDKTWQVLWNWNDHKQHHHIEPHADLCATYNHLDPIASLSFGHGGVLTLTSNIKRSKTPVGPTKMLYQSDGDALLMAGQFQSEFLHGVPARRTWSELRSSSMYAGMQTWEKTGMSREIEMHQGAVTDDPHVRMNCTIRWHSSHFPGCPQAFADPSVLARPGELSTPAAGSRQRTPPKESSTQATQPLLTGAAQAPAARVQEPPVFSGIRRQDSVDEQPSSSKTQRLSSLEESHETIRHLLACIDACVRHSELFALAINGTPLVGATSVHEKTLQKIVETVDCLRRQLLIASEAVQRCGFDESKADGN